MNETRMLTSADDVFRELLNSKMHGNIIGITSPVLGEGIFLTSVQEVVQDESGLVIIIKPYDSSGFFFPTNRLHLPDIVSVFPFKSKFENPFIRHLSTDREDRQSA